jgi:alpha-L-fucosidase
MSVTRREFMIKSAAAAAALTIFEATVQKSEASRDLGDGPVQPTWDSLAVYECPEWFRDAKFGLWAHWSAQCVPEQGDWYAKQMYIQGNPDYEFHCKTYGHPSKVGFKEIDHLWKAENWDPSAMMALYKAAGAKYFVALANHHDNFDCFDSKYQPWNSTKVGPMKDIVGIWSKEARKAGLRFGVTVHASHTWNWFEVAQGSDSTGPLAGVPYDGKLTIADSAGTWWGALGLDPQDLYAQNHPIGGGGWEFEGSTSPPSQAYCEKFYNRTVDLIDKYDPDLLYFDDTELPLHNNSDVGLRIAAHYYNASINRRKGKIDVVLNTKGLDDQQRKCMVLDFERGNSDTIEVSPWQTDTCIGGWHYQRSLYLEHGYKTTSEVVKTLLDIVSKNGNLLLNIPVRGDGTFDQDEIDFLKGMAAWMKVNDEAIYATRPWKIPGEGPVKIHGGSFSEGGVKALGERDFRFTTKDNVLYAAAMGWPDDNKLVVQTLAGPAAGIAGTITSVELLGHGNVSFLQTDNGLEADLPADKPCDIAYVLKIKGLDLAASNPQPLPISAAEDGSLTLAAEQATLTAGLKLQGGGISNIGYWNSPADFISWNVTIDKPGQYGVDVKASSEASSSITISDGLGATLVEAIANTQGWNTYQDFTAGILAFASAGVHTITVKPTDASTWQPVNIAQIVLKPSAN